MKSLIELNNRTWIQIVKMMESDFDSPNGQHLWDFDVFKFEEAFKEFKEWVLPHFGIRLFMRYGLIEKFQMSESNLKNLLVAIKDNCYETTQFHNVLRIIDTTTTFHYCKRGGVVNAENIIV